MMKYKKWAAVKVIAYAATFSMLLPYATPVKAADIKVMAESIGQTKAAVGINVQYHTEDEIRNYINQSGAKVSDKVTYAQEPYAKGDQSVGALSQATLDSSLKMLNQIRYIAGLSYDVKLNDKYNQMAQAGAFLNAANQALSHTPTKPDGVSEELYQLGYEGTSHSNIAWGYTRINSGLLEGYMYDGDKSNIDRVGHRRWILNPPMDETGFGMVDTFQAMYAFGEGGSGTQYGVLWPAQTMPTEYFKADYPWSISMGYEVDMGAVEVTLTRDSDQKVWKFSSQHADGYFNINNGGYGQTGCIIFLPDGVKLYADDDIFHVTITGLQSPVSYDVRFFDLVPVRSISFMDVKDDTISLTTGNTEDMDIEIEPKMDTNKEYELTSSNPSVAKINKYGQIEAVKCGIANVTATMLSSKKTATIKVIVRPLEADITEIDSYKSKQMVVKYNKVKDCDGYEISYATNKRFSQDAKIVDIQNAKTEKKTIKGLKSGKRYYVRCRAYKMWQGEKIYGDYCFVNDLKIM